VKLFVSEARLPAQASFFAELRDSCGRVQPMEPGSETLSFALLDHRTNLKDQPGVPAAHLIVASDGVSARDDLEAALQQVWDWPLARDAVSRARGEILITDMMAFALDRKARLALLQSTVRTLAKLTPTVAIHWMPSQRVVDPAAFVSADAELGPVYSAAVNVRMFRIEGRAPGEIVMDTLGMAAFGLPDLQCHFAGLDPGAVAARLFGYATYMFDAGDVIEDGHTVEGIPSGKKWKCRHERSLVGPEREVLDLHPGAARPR
jgi:Domain of unknown function (DUF4261)